MEAIQSLSGRCRIATPSDTVLHSECAFTYYNPFSSDQGIVVNMNTFMGTIPELAFNGNNSENNMSSLDRDIFLRVVKSRVEKVSKEGEDQTDISLLPPPPPPPTKLAIGVEGGFSTDDDKYEIVTQHSIVVMAMESNRTNPSIVTEITFDDDTKSIPAS
jgi:ubiquitin carboxyl-terminal hydrolase 5/13